MSDHNRAHDVSGLTSGDLERTNRAPARWANTSTTCPTSLMSVCVRLGCNHPNVTSAWL